MKSCKEMERTGQWEYTCWHCGKSVPCEKRDWFPIGECPACWTIQHREEWIDGLGCA